MEASDKQLTVHLGQDLSDVVVETCSDHQSAIDAHLECACRQSYEAGQLEATRQAEVRLKDVQIQQHQETQTVLNALTHAVPEMLKEAEQAIKELAISVAQKFVATCPVTEKRIQDLVQESLNSIQRSSKVTVHLHPEDLVLIEQAEQPIVSEQIEIERITFKAASGMTRGGCRIETDFGEIDATVEAKTNQINNLLTGPSLAA